MTEPWLAFVAAPNHGVKMMGFAMALTVIALVPLVTILQTEFLATPLLGLLDRQPL
jgi:hypothetical protein